MGSAPRLRCKTHFRPLRHDEAPPETGRSFSITDGRSITFSNRRFTGLAYGRSGIAIGGVTAALLIGKRAGPTPDHPRTQRWYRNLDKPDYTPPSPVYPVAWTAIQAGLAYGGYRLMTAQPSPERTAALALWSANQVGIGGWSDVFFGNRAPGWGTVASAALGVGAVGYVAAANRVDGTAAKLGMPLVAWVAFATLLSEEIWRRNDTPA